PIARARIEEHQLEAELAQRALHCRRIQLVNEEDLDPAKSRLGSRVEPLQDRKLRPEHGQVGGEARHAFSSGACPRSPRPPPPRGEPTRPCRSRPFRGRALPGSAARPARRAAAARSPPWLRRG